MSVGGDSPSPRLIAMVLTAIPFIWILWSEWGPPTLFRQAVYEDNFFDLQTRAMFHGHLSLPNGALGLEGFVHDGRTYTYFGLFGSIIRMPILLITSSLDGKLTTLSILVAWLVTGCSPRCCSGKFASSSVAMPPWEGSRRRATGS